MTTTTSSQYEVQEFGSDSHQVISKGQPIATFAGPSSRKIAESVARQLDQDRNWISHPFKTQ